MRFQWIIWIFFHLAAALAQLILGLLTIPVSRIYLDGNNMLDLRTTGQNPILGGRR